MLQGPQRQEWTALESVLLKHGKYCEPQCVGNAGGGAKTGRDGLGTVRTCWHGRRARGPCCRHRRHGTFDDPSGREGSMIHQKVRGRSPLLRILLSGRRPSSREVPFAEKTTSALTGARVCNSGDNCGFLSHRLLFGFGPGHGGSLVKVPQVLERVIVVRGTLYVQSLAGSVTVVTVSFREWSVSAGPFSQRFHVTQEHISEVERSRSYRRTSTRGGGDCTTSSYAVNCTNHCTHGSKVLLGMDGDSF